MNTPAATGGREVLRGSSLRNRSELAGWLTEASRLETAIVEKGDFLGRRHPRENFVPVRKASEALDRVVMQLRPANQFLVLRRHEKLEAGFLIGEVLAVLEGEIKERLLGQFDFAVEAAFACPSRHGQRDRIGRECARGTSKHVAWKLVEHDDERERALRLLFPACELAEFGGLMRDEEFFQYPMVKFRVGFEPALRPRLPPERKHLIRRCDLCHRFFMTCAQKKASTGGQSLIAPDWMRWQSA